MPVEGMRPVRWSPPAAPARARRTVSEPPMPALRRIDLPAAGPEDVVLDAEGRLLRRTPDGRVETLLDGLQFANGVVLAPDCSCVLVAETGAYRITRLWLSGPKAGTHDILIDNLPGFPDNMSLGSDGLVWVGIPTPRNPLLDRLHPLPGLLRRAVWALPPRLTPKPRTTTWVLAVSFDGELVHDLQADHGYSMVTSVCERDGVLYLGSLHEPAIAVTIVPRA
jgi:hypothetical protein